MKLTDYLDPSLIQFLDASSRDEAIFSLINAAAQAGKLGDEEAFKTAVLNREKVVSTGIGMGVALPHAKLASSPQFFVAIGIQKGEGIEWNALDKAPVKLVFLIGGPPDKQNEYLHLLSEITTKIKSSAFRKQLLSLKTADKVVELFS